MSRHSKLRKPNRKGSALRAEVLAFVRERGTVTLRAVAGRFGQSPAVTHLLILAQTGLIDVLDHDEFRASSGQPSARKAAASIEGR